jgi:hypothetical protein
MPMPLVEFFQHGLRSGRADPFQGLFGRVPQAVAATVQGPVQRPHRRGIADFAEGLSRRDLDHCFFILAQKAQERLDRLRCVQFPQRVGGW